MRLTNVFEAEYPGWFRIEPALFPSTPDSMAARLCGRTIIASQRIIEAKFDPEKRHHLAPVFRRITGTTPSTYRRSL
jgi:hypothetical protein